MEDGESSSAIHFNTFFAIFLTSSFCGRLS